MSKIGDNKGLNFLSTIPCSNLRSSVYLYFSHLGSQSYILQYIQFFFFFWFLSLASSTDQIAIADHPVVRANRFPQHPRIWEDLLNIISASEDSYLLKDATSTCSICSDLHIDDIHLVFCGVYWELHSIMDIACIKGRISEMILLRDFTTEG